MSTLDWIIMLGTLFGIVLYGVLKTRNVNSVKSYLLGDKDLPWYTIGLSIMATQASAITFLSTPGKAYEDGMGFAQFYFGMPVAMVFLCIFILPIYYRLNVFTAYEYLEGRFDLKTRTLTACLFLIQRGFAAGITIFAPAIILSNILGWDLNLTILFISAVVIFYTVMGGTKAVSVTQKQQMIVILAGMVVAAILIVLKFPADISFSDAVGVAGKMGKLEVVNFEFDLSNKYTFWSGMLGGVFLFLSYFGTDQSQVQRYLSGKSLNESRLGLLFNGIIKVPMQFLVLFTGILVFLFFQFTKAPIHFNSANLKKIERGAHQNELADLQTKYDAVFDKKQLEIRQLVTAINQENTTNIQQAQSRIDALMEEDLAIRADVDALIIRADTDAEVKDGDYVFINFIMNHLPKGLIGLLLAVIFSAAMSSTASELNALATTTVIDIYKRSVVTGQSDQHYLIASKGFTVLWGLIALSFALFASLFDNLIEAVNIIGSVFYGSILGIFLLAFFAERKGLKSLSLGIFSFAALFFISGNLLLGLDTFATLGSFTLGGAILGQLLYSNIGRIGVNAVFIGAIIAELLVIAIFLLDKYEYIQLGYLWLNLIGCTLVVVIAGFLQLIFGKE